MADKPGSVENNHSSGTYITACLKQPTQERYGPYLFAMQTALLFGLAPGGVYPATTIASRAVRSYRTISPLPNKVRRYIFCGTFHKLTLSRCYLAPCPLEPGLSSLLVILIARLSGHLWSTFYCINSSSFNLLIFPASLACYPIKMSGSLAISP